MKTYEERTADILAKAKEEKSRRRKRIFAASTTLSCVCIVIAAAIIAGVSFSAEVGAADRHGRKRSVKLCR